MKRLKKKIVSWIKGARLERRLAAQLSDGDGRRIFLFNVPSHGNLGDHLICMAERVMIRDFFGREPVLLSAADVEYGLGAAARHVRPQDLVLIHGGGYLGSIWEKEEMRSRRIIEAFPKNNVVVMPQTVYYDDTARSAGLLSTARSIYAAHGNLTLALRERKSYDFVRAELLPGSGRALLLPDMALYLGACDRGAVRDRILFCLRGDKERIDNGAVLESVRRAVGDSADIGHIDTVVPYGVRIADEEAQIDRLFAEFSRARLVVTDRLHGMIFSLLSCTPVVAMDNMSGKVRAVYEDWLADIPYVRFAGPGDDVADIVAELLRSPRPEACDTGAFRARFDSLRRIMMMP